MQHKLTVCSLEELVTASTLLAEMITKTGRNIVLLYGNLGAGKTAFVKSYITSQNKHVDVDSPTFSIVNEYVLDQKTVYHFDLYRMNTIEEIEDLGFWDYIDSSAICIIEWPNKIADLLPHNQTISVNIELDLTQCREFVFSYL